MLFKNRNQAGKKLAEVLSDLARNEDVIVLALPRGGVVLGYEIACQLQIALDVILVRKLGVPWQEELAFGAIAGGGIEVLNSDVINMLHINNETIQKVVAVEKQELERRNQLYRRGKPFPNLNNKIVILVDDGIATGATMRAAIKVVNTMDPQRIIVAVPVASSSIFSDMRADKVELIVLETPEPFFGIGMRYGDFNQVSDQEVISCLKNASKGDK